MIDTANHNANSAYAQPAADDRETNTPEVMMASPTAAVETTEMPALSKNQQKRRIREALRLANKSDRRAKERALRKEKKAEKRRLVEEEGADPIEIGLQKKRARTEPAVPFDATIVIDLSFDDKMSEKEIKSMSTQLGHVYNVNRNAHRPVKVLCTPMNGRLKERMHGLIAGQHLRWKGMNFRSERLQQLWQPTTSVADSDFAGGQTALATMDKTKVIYLTADSPNLLETLDEGKTYVIGGIVDHNRYKNLCFDIAEDLGIAHAALPIGKYIQMASRKVLTVNQCFDIMSRWLECRDWEHAFTQAIPQRKLQVSNGSGVPSKPAAVISDNDSGNSNNGAGQ